MKSRGSMTSSDLMKYRGDLTSNLMNCRGGLTSNRIGVLTSSDLMNCRGVMTSEDWMNCRDVLTSSDLMNCRGVMTYVICTLRIICIDHTTEIQVTCTQLNIIVEDESHSRLKEKRLNK
jgi:hypothetical protein